MNYSEQLLHPNWQKKKAEIILHYDGQCQRCFDRESTLHVHHKSYESGKLAWEYDNTNFVLLCETCHSNFHKNFRLSDFENKLHCIMSEHFTETDIYIFEYYLILLESRYGKSGVDSLIKYVLALILDKKEI